ncbi:hypothetical protein [Microcoleus sp. OTE_8_concoct_300]|uniref:hypothetical protein n=1 Tax=Microcoleus sp. OTE_8_concoct_300 TaxID=2964710 RepID=UPI00403F9FE2
MPVPQQMNFLVEQASCLFVNNRQDACSTTDEFSCLGTGKMPVPKQEWSNISVETFCLIQTPLLR